MNDLANLIAWAREHWDEPPVRMHSGGVEPDSEFGAPRWDERWRRWMEGIGKYGAAYSTNGTEEASVRCDHPSVQNDSDADQCPDCGGVGRVLVKRGIYRWPMRAALASISNRDVPTGWPRLDSVVWALASSGWSIEALMVVLAPKHPRMGDVTFAVGVVTRALTNCRNAYHQTTKWKRVPESQKSESQRSAEAA